VRRWVRIFDHGAGEDVFAAERTLGVPVLAGLRGADLEDLAGFGFKERVAAFTEGAGLAGAGE
jgi:hypothetical protein